MEARCCSRQKEPEVVGCMTDKSVASDSEASDTDKWLETVILKVHSKTQEQDRNFEHLTTQLTQMYGSHESLYQIQLEMAKRVQQPGERLRDFADSLREIGVAHPDIPEDWYVEAFIRGINNTDWAMVVRIQKPTALSDAAQFAVENFGDYGEGYQVKQWQKAAALYRGRQHCNGLAAGEARTEFPGRNPVKMQHQDDARPPRYDTRGRRLADQRNEALSPAARHAIAVAVRVGEAAVLTTSRSAIRNSNEADRIEGARRSGDAGEVIQVHAFTVDNEDQDADKKHSFDKQYKDGKNSKYIMDAMGMIAGDSRTDDMVASYNETDTAMRERQLAHLQIGAVKLKHGVDTVKYKGEHIRLSGGSSAVVTKTQVEPSAASSVFVLTTQIYTTEASTVLNKPVAHSALE
ncbi:hypothetical protein PHYSODRAFT_342411 [Phytophthora sojae]|uniref:Retrotransposon gag domain-containing protein n=1 Tax=Phytophthora sojae (strain P6497) TaxID=1094619 RepID=G5AGA9_PHYSP|nr:hypothetical protein PHYSODRAFT_342411 [Phytophthora sojae]EGZ05621.1 hypothetical protein PHYSODRAFT_342411 [Phytophthora sojae]|eukprot:XP_009539152.1 hypothetical protein PHYSODRAFT_342411 [Phytophthora sojae]